MKEVNNKFEKLDVDVIEMALHLEERFYPHLLTTIVGSRWLLTHGIKLAISKCLYSPEYLSALGAAISRAIKKGMQDGLAAGITHGQEGRVLSDVAMFNPFAESDYISAFQELQDVNFSLLAELKSTLRDVFVSIVKPLSSVALEGMESTSVTVPETTTALSVTFVSIRSTPPISMDDYEIAHAEDQGNVGADVDPFPNVDDAELIIS
ncbi:hypothetical protein Tco_1498753 [Tanacetum coccineum]